MAFTETIKKEVRQRAAFQCCRCKSIGVEVHHIIPQEHGGEDTIENAAPLCPNCHTDFGDNTKKRSAITEMRDWWYKVVKNNYNSNPTGLKALQEINEKIESVKQNLSDISELKQLLTEFTQKSINSLTPKNAVDTATQAISAVTLGDKVHAGFHCKKCGTTIGLLIGTNVCPNCGTPIIP